MWILILYIIISISLGIIGGYLKWESDDTALISLLWPIFIPLSLIVVATIISPYYIGKWIKEYKTNQISLIEFIKYELSL